MKPEILRGAKQVRLGPNNPLLNWVSLMKKINAQIHLILLVIVGIVGCQHRSGGWLLGDWVYDAELSREQNERVRDDSVGLFEFFNQMASSVLAAALEGGQMTITDSRIILLTKAGVGTARSYEILESPDANTLRVQLEDNQVFTYHREGELIWMNAPLNTDYRLYFRRAE